MSKLFDVEFEIWVPDRILGAATQSQYSEGKDRMALAHYPGVHYDYLRKPKIKEKSIASSHLEGVDTPSKATKDEAIKEDEPLSYEKDPKIRKIGTDLSGHTDLGSREQNASERTGNMTLDELVVIPPIPLGNAFLDNLGTLSSVSPALGDLVCLATGINGTFSPAPNGLDPAKKDIPEEALSDEDPGNHARLKSGIMQTRNPISLPDDPSLGKNINDEGSALNVNQKATGPI